MDSSSSTPASAVATTTIVDTRERILNINVGVLGHVDSGKTSLVKALSTSLSTAALDKHPQSQQRGITLDLGFSAFALPLPSHIEANVKDLDGKPLYDSLQFTLVDCPGHASLIRTIIGGAQIIDMIILVIDVNKGIQAQTAECIVIAEITTDNLLIVLNKIDLLVCENESDRVDKIEKMKRKIRKQLSKTKFCNCLIVPISAMIGGEKVAANMDREKHHHHEKETTDPVVDTTEGIDILVKTLTDIVPIPKRNINSPFYFAIDHCFPIRGHGTVLTGTVLSGSIAVNQMIELPLLQLQRKVKSMQMFHKSIKYVKQGDRVGMCVTNLDSKLIERGIACTPQSVPLIQSALCLVKKIRYFKFPCKTGSKFHISVGHNTLLANVTFFGGDSIPFKSRNNKNLQESTTDRADSDDNTDNKTMLTSAYQKPFPSVAFDWGNDYLMQEKIIDPDDTKDETGNEVQWALLQFPTAIYAPLGSLIIGSKLDTDVKETSLSASSSAVQSCRLAFYGPIRDIVNENDLLRLNVYLWKEKECEVYRISDFHDGLVFEAIGWKLVTEKHNIHTYIGMSLLTETGVVGSIISSYGNDGMFKIKFANGARIKEGNKLLFKYKKFIFDKQRRFTQPEFDLSISDTPFDESEFPGKDVSNKTESISSKSNKKKKNKEVLIAESMQNMKLETSSEAKESFIVNEVKDPSVAQIIAVNDVRCGTIESIKMNELNTEKVAVVNGLFRMEENIKHYVDAVVTSNDNSIIGNILGPFGKLGKCKVKLVSDANFDVGSTVQLIFPSK